MASNSSEADSHPLPSTRPLAGFENRRVGPYALQSELGHGGMGSVWLAQRDDGQYEGRVAIKVLSTSWLGQDAERRFRQEGTLLARLDHPNIAKLHDAGVTETGEPYLVLEYIEGERIDEYCNRADLSIEARIRLFLQLLSAVAHAHRNLIVHRDIKPANVLVNASGKVKLLDFGISKLVQEPEQDSSLTRTGFTCLTPQYAAPEQLLGEPVTTSTDIYALGLLLYLLLSGRLPYAATASPAELMRLITTGSMPLPSSIATEQLRAGAGVQLLEHSRMHTLRRQLRGDLDNIVLKAVQASPEHRYQDVGAFATDLLRYLNHEPVGARSATALYRLRKFMRRNRTGVVATLLVLLSTTVGGVVSVTQWLEAKRQRDVAYVQAVGRGLFSDFLHFALNSEGGPDRPAMTLTERLQRSAKSLEKRYAKNPSFAGFMLLQLAESVPDPSQAGSVDMLERAYRLGRQTHDEAMMTSALCGLARRLTWIGRPDEASQRLQQARLMLSRLDDPEGALHLQCGLGEAVFEQARGNRAKATQLLHEAVDFLDRKGADAREGYVELLSYLASAYYEDSKFAAAVEVTERAMRLQRELGIDDTSSYVQSLQNLAVLRLAIGEVRKSQEELEQVSQLSRRFSEEDAEPLTSLYNYVNVLLRMEHSAKALALVDRNYPRAQAEHEPAMLLRLLHAKTWAYVQLRDWASASRTLNEAQPLVASGAGGKALLSDIETLRASIALAQQDSAAARKHMAAALSLAGYATGAPERSLSDVLLAAADLALSSARYAEAEKFASDSLRISELVARNADSSADVGAALLMLARAQAQQAPRGQLHRLLERAVRCLTNGLGAEHRLTLQARGLLEKT